MEAVLYVAATGTLILVPNCFKPCKELEQAHGEFRVCGRVSVADLMSPLWCRILSDFEEQGYAIIGAGDADRLFGAEALWGFSDRRGAPREEKLSYAQVRQRMVRWTRVGGNEAPVVEARRSARNDSSVAARGRSQQVRKGIDAVGDAPSLSLIKGLLMLRKMYVWPIRSIQLFTRPRV